MILVDSSAWIDYFRGTDSPCAERLGYEIGQESRLFAPGVVLTELLLGAEDDIEAARVLRVLTPHLEGPPLTRPTYLEAARIYRACRAKGVTIRSTIDCLIAALAILDDLPLLAKDGDFDHIARHTKLRLAAAA